MGPGAQIGQSCPSRPTGQGAGAAVQLPVAEPHLPDQAQRPGGSERDAGRVTQGRRAAQGSSAAHAGALLTRDGVSELGDHLLTNRHLVEKRKGGGKKERREEGKGAKEGEVPQTQSRQAAQQDSGKAIQK